MKGDLTEETIDTTTTTTTTATMLDEARTTSKTRCGIRTMTERGDSREEIDFLTTEGSNKGQEITTSSLHVETVAVFTRGNVARVLLVVILVDKLVISKRIARHFEHEGICNRNNNSKTQLRNFMPCKP